MGIRITIFATVYFLFSVICIMFLPWSLGLTLWVIDSTIAITLLILNQPDEPSKEDTINERDYRKEREFEERQRIIEDNERRRDRDSNE